jgi:perosamine synthetase
VDSNEQEFITQDSAWQQSSNGGAAAFLRSQHCVTDPIAGYTPLNKQPFLKEVLGSKAYKAIYSAERLKECEEKNQCPENDRLCEEAVKFGQTMLLGKHSDMDQIAEAIRKIHDAAGALGNV